MPLFDASVKLRDFMGRIFISFIVAVIFSNASLADTLKISRDVKDTMPASDLLLRDGTRIDTQTALSLSSQGTDLSQLDPIPNDVWDPARSSLETPQGYPTAGSTVKFHEVVDSSNLFQATIFNAGRPYHIVLSPMVQQGILLNRFLKALGYVQDSPQWLATLNIEFATVEELDQFKISLKEVNRIDPELWVVQEDRKQKILTVKDVAIEPARVLQTRYYWGFVNGEYIQNYRATRAIVAAFALMNFDFFQRSLNLFPWEFPKIADDAVLFDHPFAQHFTPYTSIDDVKWITRRIAALTEAQWQTIISASGFNPSIRDLIYRKLVTRRDGLVRKVLGKKEFPLFKPKTKFDSPPWVVKGEVPLDQERDPCCVVKLSTEEREAPLRWSELKHIFKMELIGQTLREAISHFDDLIQVKSFDSALRQQLDKYLTYVVGKLQEHQVEHPGEPFTFPIIPYAIVTGGFNLNLNRSLNSGTYYGSDSRAQLVDTFSIGANVGGFVGVNGTQDFSNTGVKGRVQFQRAYVHVRPLTSLAAVKEEPWKYLFVPSVQKQLRRLLDTKTVPGPDGPSDAEVKRVLKGFFDQFKTDEVLTVVDGWTLNLGAQAAFSLVELAGPALAPLQPSVGFSFDHERSISNRIMITRKADTLQVYDSRITTRTNAEAASVSAWIELARGDLSQRKGKTDTQAIVIDLRPFLDDEQSEDTAFAAARLTLLRSLQDLFRSNETELLKKNEASEVIPIAHQLKGKTRSGKVLQWNWSNYRESHEVEIVRPEHPTYQRSLEDRTLTIYTTRTNRIDGKAPYALFGQVLNRVLGTDALFQTGPNLNPSGTLFGRAHARGIQVDGNVTGKHPFLPYTFITENFIGWNLSQKKLLNILDGLSSQFEYLNQGSPLYSVETFQNMTKLQAFDIQSRIALYPEAITTIEQALDPKIPEADRTRYLLNISDTAALDPECDADPTSCRKAWMKRLFKWMEKRPAVSGATDAESRKLKKSKLDWIHGLVDRLMRRVHPGRFLEAIGKENYFVVISVSGFRKGDEAGDETYFPDSLGTFGVENRKSPYQQVFYFKWDPKRPFQLGEYELRALYFGNGL